MCRTATTKCAFDEIAGPQKRVKVRTVGRDATVSARASAPLTGHGQILITTVYFASASATLTKADGKILDSAIRRVHRFGFGRANLDGYTDSDGGFALNRALSKRRTAAVAAYLKAHGDIGAVQWWFGESNPVASNQGATGKAKNRRVEILVRY